MSVFERAASQPEPLVPLLPLEGSAPDPVALATWHLALASTTAVEVPHDLFALWLFPASGGVVLLGPEALAQDAVEVPVPEPHLLQDQLYQLEQVLRRAHYGSAIAVPVRHEGRDVAVMLLGSFQSVAFGPAQALALKRLAGRLATTLAPLGAVMSATAPHAALEPVMTREALPAHVARVAAEAANGPDLVRRLSGVLYPLLPHDRLEILATGTGDGGFVPLSGHPLQRGGSGSSGEPFAAIIGRFGDAPTLVVDDLTEIAEAGPWAIGSDLGSPRPARGVLGTRLDLGGECVGYLLIGSVGREAYRPDDEDTLAAAGVLLASRVAGFRLADEVLVLRAELAAVETTGLPLVRAAEALAATGHLAEALNRFSAGMRELVPHSGITLHLRWGEDEVITLNPEAPRPFADIPAIALDDFAGAAVLRGALAWLVRPDNGAEEMIVPLLVAGRIVGTLGVRADSFSPPGNAAANIRLFANLLAPHLELLRRGARAGIGPGAGTGSGAASRTSKAPAAIEQH